MPARVLADDVDPDLVARYLEVERRFRRSAPRRFRKRWRCERDLCDGMPHDEWDYPHARSSQVVPQSWSYDQVLRDPDSGEPLIGPDGDALTERRTTSRIAYLVGGRGSGKTWAGAHNFAQLILDTDPEPGDDHTEWAVIAPTYRSARHVCIEGPSGLIRALGGFKRGGGFVEQWNRSDGELRLTTGAIVYIDGAGDGAERIQGENLYGAWCDEIGLWKAWKRAWQESLAFAVRIGPARVICTGTPKLSSLAKYLLDDPAVWRKRLRTVDNIANLSADAVGDLLARYQGTRLGQQELEGLLVDDVEGALWKRAVIDAYRVHEHVILEGPTAGTVYWERADGSRMRPPSWWQRIVVGLDPADGEEDGDEQGIAVLGHSPDDHELYVLHAEGTKMAPFDWLCHAVDLALTYEPSPVTLVIEKNHGGAYLTGLLEQVLMHKGVRVPYQVVDARNSKRTRAESVSGMWERGKVHHVGTFADLEDQMCTFTGTGKEPSPDQMDALVWAAKEFDSLLLETVRERPGDAGVYRWADMQSASETVKMPKEDAGRVLRPIRW